MAPVGWAPPTIPDRIRPDGKFFRFGRDKWFIKGLTYGPFAPNSDGHYLPSASQTRADFSQIKSLGATALRLYHIPPRWFLDEALAHDLRLFIDVPWDKHRCFLEDRATMDDARRRIGKAARLLGDHPATFAISVANEIPSDIVRYHGHRRVGRFIDELIDIVKQNSPDCLATYTNYPSTEYLTPTASDFCCFNLYLEDPQRFSNYLSRLHHVAGPLPLLLGEIGLDSQRNGSEKQSQILSALTRQSIRHGLAGSFIFSFTDDWFVGGYQIDNWGFGITSKDRTPKPAASALSSAWQRTTDNGQLTKRISIIICSYNSAPTLEECLNSLVTLNYPDYEILLIDDGSTDNTREIASRFPGIKYIHQENEGLSAARNTGLRRATGEVVAYTDADCFADEDWLQHLMTAMDDQNLDAIGGPNLPPPNGCPMAKCIAASPGSPTHVMVDDRNAEHIPGCNMAFRRQVLLDIGGFDPRFRQAGDDVDICWRLLDAGKTIGFAPTAQIWHHRRGSISAYLKQQAGYGKAESLLHQKHPHRFTRLGAADWTGIIYNAPSPSNRATIDHGQFGSALFQMIYRQPGESLWSYPLLFEWHLLALFTLALAFLFPPIGLVTCALYAGTLLASFRSARSSHPTVLLLNILQPLIRGGTRRLHRLFTKRLPRIPVDDRHAAHITKISRRRCDLYWTSADFRGREHLLEALQEESLRTNFEINYRSDEQSWDALITGHLFHDIQLHTATENLGGHKKFTRARLTLQPTLFSISSIAASLIFTVTAAATQHVWATLAGATGTFFLISAFFLSQRPALAITARLLHRSGNHARLDPILSEAESSSYPLPVLPERAG